MLHSHHDHSHDHGGGNYFVEQLAMIGVCGALGGVAVLLYVNGVVRVMLNEKLHWLVLATGIALLVVVAIRAVALWFEAAKPHGHGHGDGHGHDHDHDHDHACDHDHQHEHGDCGHHHHDHAHEHPVAAQATAGSLPLVTAPAPQTAPAAAPAPNGDDHDHGHAHGGWGPWRYAVLLLPITLFFLDLPSREGFNSARGPVPDPQLTVETDVEAPPDPAEIRELGFKELQAAVYSKESQKEYDGKYYRVKGQYVPINDQVFSLRRYKINCCAADAIPLNAFILLDSRTDERLDSGNLVNRWVVVTGRVQFRERNGQTLPVIVVRPSARLPLGECVTVTTAGNDQYIQ
jgi:hypothetical protein